MESLSLSKEEIRKDIFDFFDDSLKEEEVKPDRKKIRKEKLPVEQHVEPKDENLTQNDKRKLPNWMNTDMKPDQVNLFFHNS